MPIVARCACGKEYRFKDEYAGRRAKCTACGQMIHIPGTRAPGMPKPPRPQREVSPEGEQSRTRELALLGSAAFVVLVGIGLVVYFLFLNGPVPRAPKPAAPSPATQQPSAAAASAPAQGGGLEGNEVKVTITNTLSTAVSFSVGEFTNKNTLGGGATIVLNLKPKDDYVVRLRFGDKIGERDFDSLILRPAFRGAVWRITERRIGADSIPDIDLSGPATQQPSAAASQGPVPASGPPAPAAGPVVEPGPASVPSPVTSSLEVGTSTPAMFLVEKGVFSTDPIECCGCTVSPAKGHVLFVCTVRFTERSEDLSVEEFCKLKVSDTAKEFTRTGAYGKLIAFGDFQLRLRDGTMIPCAILPGTAGQAGPPVQWSGDQDGWLMYTGFVRVIASVKPDAEPVSLVWGGTYEVPVSPPLDTGTDEQPVLHQETLMKFLAGAPNQDVGGYSINGSSPEPLQEVIKKELAPRSKISVGLPKVIATAREHGKDKLSIDIHWLGVKRSDVARNLGQPHSTDEGVWALTTPKLPVIFYRYRLTKSLSLGFAFLKGSSDKDPGIVFVQLRVSEDSGTAASEPAQSVETLGVELKSCALVKMVKVGGQGLSESGMGMPMLIAPADGNRLLCVQVEVKHLDNLPQNIDLQSLEINDELGKKHSLVAFGVGHALMETPEVDYIVSGDGLEAPWMMLQGPVKAQDGYEGAGKVTVAVERGQSAKLTVIQAPIVLRLVFAFPSSAEQGVIRNIFGCSIVVKGMAKPQ